MLHWAWTLPTWFRCPLHTSTPRTLPGSSYLLDFFGLWWFPLCLDDSSLSLHLFSWHYHYYHLQLLYYCCHTECAQTYFFNNNFSPFLNKGGKFLSPNAWWKSPFGCGFHLKLNTPSHAHPRMEPMLVSQLGTMQGPSFHLLRLTFFGIVFEFLPLLKSWLILSL